MSLLAGLILRVFAIVALCLGLAGAWTMIEANRTIRSEVAATADRVVKEAGNLAWREVMFRGNEGDHAKLAFPEWRSSSTLRIIGPGYCVTLAWTGDTPTRICGGPASLDGGVTPRWFAALNTALFGNLDAVDATVKVGRHVVGRIRAEANDGAAAWQAWRQVSVVLGVAGAMAIAISLLATLAIGHALRPAETIVRALNRLESGDYAVRLPSFAAREFAHVSRAFNDLTQRLAETTAQRSAVTRRLFQVQEEERLSIARDLHDEFGQCLAATRALAAAIASSGARDRPDLSESAREIGTISEGMATSLRGTLARLRPPELAEIGLEQSLQHLVTSWNARMAATAGKANFRLEIVGELEGASDQSAVAVYRIAQEGLTNAAKHGAPSEVTVRIERASDEQVLVLIEDDGGPIEELAFGRGHGLLGLRERVDALGGRFAAEASPRGVRLRAEVPLSAGGQPAPAVEKEAA